MTTSKTSGGAGSAPVGATRMMSWIDTLVGFGIRRPGYPGDARAARWIAGQFRRTGLRHVRLEPVKVNRWKPDSCRLVWWPTADPSSRTTVDCFSLPFSKPVVDVTAQLALDDGTGTLDGAIGVYAINSRPFPNR